MLLVGDVWENKVLYRVSFCNLMRLEDIVHALYLDTIQGAPFH